MKFADRAAAGRQLAVKLAQFKDRAPVVLALPRGGVAVGFEIAQALGAPLDIVMVRKIGVPWQPELALGAVTGRNGLFRAEQGTGPRKKRGLAEGCKGQQRRQFSPIRLVSKSLSTGSGAALLRRAGCSLLGEAKRGSFLSCPFALFWPV